MKKLYTKVLRHPLLWLGILVFLPGTLALTSSFMTDDYLLLCQIRENPHNLSFLINGFELEMTKGFHEVFGSPDRERKYIIKYSRPLIIGLLILEHSIFGNSAWGYHLINLVLHLINCSLVYFILRNLMENRFTCLLAVSLYTLCPQQVISVHWISGKTEVLVAACIFAAFLFHIYYRKTNNKKFAMGIFALSLLGMGSKESIVILPFLLLLYDVLICPSHLRIGEQWGFYTLLSLLFGAFSLYSLKGFTDFSNLFPGTYFHSPNDPNFIIFCISKFVYFYFTSMFAIPATPIVADWCAGIPILVVSLSTLFVVLIILKLRVISSKNRPLFLFGVIWFFLNLLPSLPIMAQPYLLYCASFGMFLSLALLLQELRLKARRNLIKWYPQKFRVGVTLFIANCLIFTTVAGLHRYLSNHTSKIADATLEFLSPSAKFSDSTTLLVNIPLSTYFYYQLLWKAGIQNYNLEFLDCSIFFDRKPSFSWTPQRTLILKYGKNRSWLERKVEQTFLGFKEGPTEGKLYKRNGYSIVPSKVSKTGDVSEMIIFFHPETERKEIRVLVLTKGYTVTCISSDATVRRNFD